MGIGEHVDAAGGTRAPAAELPLTPQDASAQGEGFDRARAARSAELAEDYVELIAGLFASGGEARIVDIARHLGVSHATVVKAMERLKREGLVTAKPYRGVFLTRAGEALAADVHARHRLVVELLVAIGVPVEDAEADAEGIEHHVSPRTRAAFARFLGQRPGSPQGT